MYILYILIIYKKMAESKSCMERMHVAYCNNTQFPITMCAESATTERTCASCTHACVTSASAHNGLNHLIARVPVPRCHFQLNYRHAERCNLVSARQRVQCNRRTDTVRDDKRSCYLKIAISRAFQLLRQIKLTLKTIYFAKLFTLLILYSRKSKRLNTNL